MDSFWQAVAEFTPPPTIEVEHRLYYDEHGTPLFYTCDQPPGNYITVSAETYAQGRYDCKVIDGKIKYPSTLRYAKLVPGTKGTACYVNDVSIISTVETDSQHWKLKVYEKD